MLAQQFGDEFVHAGVCSVRDDFAFFFSGEFLPSFGAAPFDCVAVPSSVRSALALPISWLRVAGFSFRLLALVVFVCSSSACEGFPCLCLGAWLSSPFCSFVVFCGVWLLGRCLLGAGFHVRAIRMTVRALLVFRLAVRVGGGLPRGIV